MDSGSDNSNDDEEDKEDDSEHLREYLANRPAQIGRVRPDDSNAESTPKEGSSSIKGILKNKKGAQNQASKAKQTKA